MASIADTCRGVIPAVPDRGRTLYEEFRAVLPWFPDFATRAQQTYPWAQDSDQAIELAWEAVVYSNRPEDQSRRAARLRRMAALGIFDAVGAELFVRHILTSIGGEVRAGRRRLTGVHYHSQQRFAPDPSCLDTVRGEDRVRNRCRDADSHVIVDIRFHDPEPAADQTAPAAGQLAFAFDAPPAAEVTPEALQKLYDARLTVTRVPTVLEDRAWARQQKLKLKQVEDLRRANLDPRLHGRHRR